MTDSNNVEQDTVPQGKIFTENQLWVSTMLGGPLVAGYILYKNYKTFNEIEKANKVIVITLFFTVILFFAIFLIPDNFNIPNQTIPVLYTVLAWVFIRYFQGENIKNHINSGGEKAGWGKTILISILALTITFIPVLILGMIPPCQ